MTISFSAPCNLLSIQYNDCLRNYSLFDHTFNIVLQLFDAAVAAASY